MFRICNQAATAIGRAQLTVVSNEVASTCTRLFSINAEDTDKAASPTTPWVRQVISGVDLMRHPKYNKGLAFSESERDRLYLRGLLPSACLSQEVQLERTVLNIRSKNSDLDKHTYLYSLCERNERLFYRVLMENIEELLPVVSAPTVHHACEKVGLMFRALPNSMFLSIEDRGRIYRILKNWPERNVKLVVLSDGEQVGFAGDLGVQSIYGPISKLSLYTACAGFEPSFCLPISIDVGTDSDELLRSPFYVGLRQRRVRGDPYYELLDEVLSAVKRRFGNTTIVHFEDMAYENTSKLLNSCRAEFPCFSDDISGIAATVVAGIMAALPRTGGKLADHKILLSGEGPLASCIAELYAAASAGENNVTVLEARRHVWLVDKHGLVTRERGDAATLEHYKLPYCHPGPHQPDLLTSVQALQPTVLIGLSTDSLPPFAFDKQVLTTMASYTKVPLVFALSAQAPECTPEDVYRWTQGRVMLATGTKEDDVDLGGGRVLSPSQATSAYIFPGVGLGALMSQPTKLRDDMFIAAAEAVARSVTESDLNRGMLYPPMSKILEVSAQVARAVAMKAYNGGYATALPKPNNLLDHIKQHMYNPQYRRYR